jgi:hypothetical protein
MIEDAGRLLRRYRDRALPDWRVQKILERELNRIVSKHSALSPEMDELRRAAPDHLEGFDIASDRVLQRFGERRFDLAWKEIQKAGQELDELRRCATVAVELRQAGAALEGLEALLSPALASQATVRILLRLRDLARALLDQGETRKAGFVILLLSRQISFLLARRPGEPKAGFERMLGDLEARGGAAATQIRALWREGYQDLAERLSDDLDVELSITDLARRASMGRALAGIENSLAAVRRQAGEVHAALTQWLESNS